MALLEAATKSGFAIMVCYFGLLHAKQLTGNSACTVACSGCLTRVFDYVDLDGPLLLAQDRTTPMYFEGSRIHPASSILGAEQFAWLRWYRGL